MSKALAWIRKSKGKDDALGLQMQRDDVFDVAGEIADDVDKLDLGIQSGFSTLTRSPNGKLLDEQPEVRAAVDNLRAGEYDYMVSYDDRRVARDEYYSVIEHAAVQGDCEMVYVSDDVEQDDLAFDIQRRVERKTKEEEIDKSVRTVRERIENGCYQGGDIYGLQLSDDDCHLERDPDQWPLVEDIIDRRENGESLRDISGEVPVSVATVKRIADRGTRWYDEKLAEYGV